MGRDFEKKNRALRRAVQENQVSFPAQVPVFEKQSRPDLQRKIAVLYFVRGWTMTDIARRYSFARQRVGQIITAWRTRAELEGYLQRIEIESPLPHLAPVDKALAPVDKADDVFDVSLLPSAPRHEGQLEQVPADDSPIHAEWGGTAQGCTLASPAVSGAVIGGPDLIDELQAIVGVLDNQLSLCSKPRFVGNRHSCDQLLIRAKELCARLEFHSANAGSHTMFVERVYEEWRVEAALAAARVLLRRYAGNTLQRSSLATKSELRKADKSNGVRPLVSTTSVRNASRSADQRVALVS
jgi:hypothetical protein